MGVQAQGFERRNARGVLIGPRKQTPTRTRALPDLSTCLQGQCQLSLESLSRHGSHRRGAGSKIMNVSKSQFLAQFWNSQSKAPCELGSSCYMTLSACSDPIGYSLRTISSRLLFEPHACILLMLVDANFFLCSS